MYNTFNTGTWASNSYRNTPPSGIAKLVYYHTHRVFSEGMDWKEGSGVSVYVEAHLCWRGSAVL